MVAIFPFPFAIRFPKSNRPTPTSPISSVVSLRFASPGRRLQLLTVQTVLSSEAVGASSSKRLPGETQRAP